MITFSRLLNSVKLELANEVHFLSPDCFIIAKSDKIYIQSKVATSQPNASYQFAPTEINGRPSDDALLVAEWLRDTYFYGITAVGGGGPIQDGVSAAITATVFDLTNSNPLATQIVDGTGTAITSFGSELRPSSATVSNVSASASSVSVLASNSARRVATFYNDSDRACYVKFGTTASATSYTVKLFPNGFFSTPWPTYTGAIDAIWDSGPTGALRVTEI